TLDLVSTFADYYDDFARTKALRRVFRPRLDALAENRMLMLSRVTHEGMPTLVWHAYAAASGHVLLMHSASLFRSYADSSDRNLIGRANRYLHWHDLLWCKAAGYESYDLGGIHLGGEDPEASRITASKLAFGGRPPPVH